MADRISLEEQIAHLTRMVEEMSQEVARQDSELRALRSRVAFLLQREAGREEDAGGGVFLGDERPPHY